MNRRKFITTSGLPLGELLITHRSARGAEFGNGIVLGGRKLHAARIVTYRSEEGESPFEAATKFCKRSFATASKVIPRGEPLDWLENQFPAKWKLQGRVVDFVW